MNKSKRILAVLLMMAFVVGLAASSGASGLVDINSASKEELMQLEGIGSAYADKIIEYREANGPFEKCEDIMNVKGVGAATFEKNKEKIAVGSMEEDSPAQH